MPLRAPPILSSRVLLDVPFMRVVEDVLRLPNGRRHPYTYRKTRHPAVIVVPITRGGKAVLVRQYRHPARRMLVEFPAGAVGPSEDPRAAARRELREETGYAAGRLVEIGRFIPQPASATMEMIFYLARGARRVADPAPEDTEEMETILWPAAEVEQRARRIRVPSSLLLAGVFFAMPYLRGTPGGASS